MATNTYVALKSITISGTSTNDVTITGIPQGYTDLVIVTNLNNIGNVAVLRGQFNGDTTTSYSSTSVHGNGSAAGSSRQSNVDAFYMTYQGHIDGTKSTGIYHVMNYSNSTTYKTVISRASSASFGVDATVSLWRKTDPITSIRIVNDRAEYWTAGSTINIYGIATVNQYTASTIPGTLKIGDVIRVTYTGASQTLSIPAGVNTMQIEMAGASGGNGPGYTGGYGGWISGTYSLGGAATTMYAYVGGKGTDVGSSGGDLAGGFNGGGKGHFPTNTSNAGYAASGGGGATDIRIGGTALSNRIAVAGGGGGGQGYLLSGGYGGYTDGGFGSGPSSPNDFSGARGLGGTQSAGGAGGAGATNGSNGGQSGSLGVGGDGGTTSYVYGQGGGGGGGYYGGGGGGSASNGGPTGGGGGSSYFGSMTDTRYYNGINLGDGYIILTVLS